MILTDKDIKETVRKAVIKIEPFDLACVQPASYDFRVGKEGLSATGQAKIDIEEKGLLLLEPGDFGVITSLETIEMPNDYTARIGIRSYYARQGLFAATGPQIDPGFRGRLFVTIMNLSPNPISLPYKEKFITVEFHRLNEPVTKPYSGEFQNRLKMNAQEIQNVIEKRGVNLAEIIKSMNGINKSIVQLTAFVSALKWIIPAIVGGGGIAIIAIWLVLR